MRALDRLLAWANPQVVIFWAGTIAGFCGYGLFFSGWGWGAMVLAICGLIGVLAGEPGTLDWLLVRRDREPPKAVVYCPRYLGPERFVLHPGYVTSKNDGQDHWISGDRLAGLHGVNRRDCITVKADSPAYRKERYAHMVHLYPRYDGCYPNYGESLAIPEKSA